MCALSFVFSFFCLGAPSDGKIFFLAPCSSIEFWRFFFLENPQPSKVPGFVDILFLDCSNPKEMSQDAQTLKGRVVSLFNHPTVQCKRREAVVPMVRVRMLRLLADRGIENSRYLDRACHVTALEVQVIDRYAQVLGQPILPGQCRANMELSGLDLTGLFRRHGAYHLKIGTSAVLHVYGLRTPCWKMDRVHAGLWDLMRGRSISIHGAPVRAFDTLNQGVKMKVVESGDIAQDDDVVVVLHAA